ncbi:MAG: hypothetical protein ACOZDY_10625 [Pseudomonadota bacterium]
MTGSATVERLERADYRGGVRRSIRALRYDVTPVGPHYTLHHFDILAQVRI